MLSNFGSFLESKPYSFLGRPQNQKKKILSLKLLELRAYAVRNSASSFVLTRFVSGSAGADSSASATRSVRNSLLRRLVRFCALSLRVSTDANLAAVGAASWFCELSLSLRWCCQIQISVQKNLGHAARGKRVDEFGSHVSRSRDITGTFKKVKRHHMRGFSGIKIKKHTACAQITATCGGRHTTDFYADDEDWCCNCEQTSAYVSIRQHTSAYVSIRPKACVGWCCSCV